MKRTYLGLALSLLLPASALATEPACDLGTPTPVEVFPEPSALEEKITGNWLYCGSVTEFPAVYPARFAGMEIAADNSVYAVREVEGTLYRQTGFDFENEGSIVPTEAEDGQKDHLFYIFGGTRLSASLHPAFSEDGRVLRVDNNGLESVYVKTDRPVVVPPVENVGTAMGADGCIKDETLITNDFGAVTELEEMLIGQWFDCRQKSSPEYDDLTPADATGIEFGRGRKWRFIYKDNPSEWNTLEILKMEGYYQVDLLHPNGEKDIFHAAFSDAPRKLKISATHLSGSTISTRETVFSAIAD